LVRHVVAKGRVGFGGESWVDGHALGKGRFPLQGVCWSRNETHCEKLVDIGKTEEGQPQLMGIVTSPGNHRKLDFYKQIARRVARAEGLSAEEADKLANEGKAVGMASGLASCFVINVCAPFSPATKPPPPYPKPTPS
jgi:hypothetical protein